MSYDNLEIPILLYELNTSNSVVDRLTPCLLLDL